MTEMSTPRPLYEITDMFHSDPAAHIVRYFLSNATSWRGEDAKRIKAELRSKLDGK